MSIETYGAGKRLRFAAHLLSELPTEARLILLPVPTTRDGKYITDTDIELSDTLLGADGNTVIIGYGLPDGYALDAAEKSAFTLELSRDEKYLSDNARITALGALGYILTTDTRTPEELSFGIVGYGRIGSSLARLLLFLGARVRVYTSRVLTRLELGECGIETRQSSDIYSGSPDFSGIDVLLNTAPKDMSESFKDGRIPSGMRVVELASGKNFNGVEGVENLPSLPERMFPESAGRAYFDAVTRFLKSNFQIDGGVK